MADEKVDWEALDKKRKVENSPQMNYEMELGKSKSGTLDKYELDMGYWKRTCSLLALRRR